MNFKSFLGGLVFIFLIIIFFFLLPQPNQQKNTKQEAKENRFPVEEDTNQEVSYADFNDSFLIRKVSLFDGDSLTRNVDIEVVEQKFGRIGANLDNQKRLKELDADGLYLIPGLIDSHTHSWGNALVEALNFGVTTELDMFTMPSFSLTHQKNRERLDNVEQADLFSATILATAPGGHGTEYGFEIPVLSKVSQVQSFVKARVDDGADYIKAVYSSTESERKHYPSISIDILKALAVESKKHQKLLVVHVDDLISAREAISAGANGLVHSFMDKVVDDDFIELMKRNNAFIIPTLQVEASLVGLSPGRTSLQSNYLNAYLTRQQKAQLKASFHDFGIPTEAFERAKKSVKRLYDEGVPILAGSDAPNPGTTHGASLHAELDMLVSSGLSNRAAIMAATSNPSKVFQLGGRGSIKPGVAASMLLLGSDPIENVRATEDILGIWKNGRFYNRVKANKSEGKRILLAGKVTDFENVDDSKSLFKTEIGFGIVPTSDKMVGGKSLVNFSLVKEKANNKNTALSVSGDIKQGFAFPWSGLSYFPGKDTSMSVNLSKLNYLSFSAQNIANAEVIDVMLFQEQSFQPIIKRIGLAETKQNFKIALADFTNADLGIINNISIVVTGSPKSFHFIIDDIAFE